MEELILGQQEITFPALVTLLCGAIAIPTEKAEGIVGCKSATKPSIQHGLLRVGQNDIAIPVGQVLWVKCIVLCNIDPSNSLVLFEPDEEGSSLLQLDVGEGLLEIQNQ